MTITEARDEILDLITTAWEANRPNSEPLFYQGQTVPLQTGDHAKAQVLNIGGNQTTLGTTAHFERLALVTVRIMTRAGKGLGSSDTLAQVALNALEGQKTDGGVWFRDVGLSDEGTDGEWNVSVVSATAIYTQVK